MCSLPANTYWFAMHCIGGHTSTLCCCMVLLFSLPPLRDICLLWVSQVRAGATLRFPRSLPIDKDDPDAFKLHVHRLSLKTLW